jgi:hypothetical protein
MHLYYVHQVFRKTVTSIAFTCDTTVNIILYPVEWRTSGEIQLDTDEHESQNDWKRKEAVN